ncbi:MAG: LLM class flavin-dependent oxidoreductase [Chloroflexi bacterium]|nr:MAG: LLM class flavin-dependent oxidoreductase [Chloroflexota bacterium]
MAGWNLKCARMGWTGRPKTSALPVWPRVSTCSPPSGGRRRRSTFRVSSSGRTEQTCRPAPLQKPRPPIWLGEARHSHWLDVIARHADGWNSVPASPARLTEKLHALRAACHRAGRDMAELELSLEVQVLVAPTEADVKSIARRIADLPSSKRGEVRPDILDAVRSDDGRPLHPTIDDWVVGTPEAVTRQLDAYLALGISHFMLWFLDFPSLDGLKLFAEQVRPALRSTL